MDERADPVAFAIKQPPTGFFRRLRYLGPGFILSAAIVGSGELVATTTLGAQAGFALLWVILLGCLVKVAVQLEYGRFCITHGVPAFQGWNRTKGLKLSGVHWSVWIGVLYMITTFAGQAGVLGGAAQVAAHSFPQYSANVWVIILVLILGAIVSHGKYEPVEIIATGFNFVFVAAVLYCMFAVLWTPYAYSLSDVAGGFQFRFNRETLWLALAAFGITGVASGEITLYPYWCLEKGYAAWAGARDDSTEWAVRARGWIGVMTLDAVVSMIVYTVATCAFYILGASVLHARVTLADGNEFIVQLSVVFTEVLGSRSRIIFVVCAFTVLFSTVFSNAAGFSRLWTDYFGLMHWIDWKDDKQRRFSISMMAWIFPAFTGLIYLTVQKPLLLVTFMGVCNAVFLIVVAYQAVIFRYRFSDPRLKPLVIYDVAFWLSLASIAFMAWRSVWSVLRDLRWI
jgi:Mn2+/Fe2+ NRAMP family transporter